METFTKANINVVTINLHKTTRTPNKRNQRASEVQER
jgi:hypothetical protein